ncbi:MAG TPA: sugar ABC transporter permease [Anaerolineaceae bacterium]|nr:sugar ABC transporter permease [Anaerolineaceae bacterium]
MKSEQTLGLKLPVKAKPSTGSGVSMRPSDYVWCYVTITPFVIIFLALTVWPIIRTVQFSLYDFNGIGEVTKSTFVGLKNYLTVIKDHIFVQSYVNSWLFTIGQTLLKLPISFLLAVLLTRKWLKLRGVFRTAFFLPWLMPPSIVAMVFNYLLNPSNGAINEFLLNLHLIEAPINFFNTGLSAFTTIAFISSWQILGQYIIFWMAALQSIPDELYEAASLDGASETQKMLRITLPLIAPMAIIISLLGLTWALGIFDWIQIMTSGGPGTQSYTVYYYVYMKAFAKMPMRYGIASAAGFLFGITVLAVFTFNGRLINYAQRKRREYGI